MNTTMNSNITKTVQHKPSRKLAIAAATGALMFALGAAAVIIPTAAPEAGANVADSLRAILGPEPVAWLESAIFRITDTFNQAKYKATSNSVSLTFTDQASSSTSRLQVAPAAPIRAPGPAPVSAYVAGPAIGPAMSKATLSITRAKPASAVTAVNPFAFAPPANAASTASTISAALTLDARLKPVSSLNWQMFGPTIAGRQYLDRAIVQPDPSRPYANVALVRMDLRQVRLDMLPGTSEPKTGKAMVKYTAAGVIPNAVQQSGTLLAAFSGGFKGMHGGYGMAVNNTVILPPLDGMGTVAIYKDGSMRIGAWGRDIVNAPDLVSYRQNCPLLVDAGGISAAVNNTDRKQWGFTIGNTDTTWRSGLGITQDGHYLIYGVGNSLTVESLAKAMRISGTYTAMQLDINRYYTRFDTYGVQNGKIIATKLLKEMSGDASQFLKPYDRDFFYLTVKG